MPKRRNPLPSEAASGKMDEQTIFSTRFGKTYRKRYVIPRLRFSGIDFWPLLLYDNMGYGCSLSVPSEFIQIGYGLKEDHDPSGVHSKL